MSASPLLLQFYQKHPSAAADELQGYSQEFIVAQINACPISTTTGLLACFSPLKIADIFDHMTDEQLSQYIQAAPFEKIQLLLRHLSTEQKKRLIANSPSRLGRTLTGLSEEAIDSALAFTKSTFRYFICSDTISHARRSMLKNTIQAYYFVVDESDKLLGTVTSKECLSSKAQTVGEIVRSFPYPIPTTTPKSQVLVNPAWRHYQLLPVIDQLNHLVGVISIQDVVYQLQGTKQSTHIELLESSVELVSDALSELSQFVTASSEVKYDKS